MERMPFEEISRRDRLRPELAYVAIVETVHDKSATDENWRSSGPCLEVDPEIFFPGKGGSARAARKICAECKVQEQCLEAQLALSNYDDGGGIWGGTTEQERRKMRRERKEASQDS